MSEPTQLQEDSGEYFRDQNGARYPAHPIEPAVRAILALDPSFSAQDIDVFACGSTLGNLLRVVRNEEREFRFTVEVIGNTAFFVRRENVPDEKIPGVYGYGHTFPEKYTLWEKDVVGSASHQRLIKYNFGGLNYIIRSESDGYLEDEAAKYNIDEQETKIPPDLDGLTMLKGGKTIPQQAIFDLKTRSAKKKDEDVLADQIARFWVNQTSNFILAFHERGLFKDIRVQSVRSEVKEWERQHGEVLRKLSNLVEKVVACAKTSPGSRCEVRSRQQGVLELRYVGGDAPHALPEHLSRLWAGTGSSEPTSDEDTEAGGAYTNVRQGYDEEDDDDGPSWSDDESEKDYTACSAEDCGYCGRCKY